MKNQWVNYLRLCLLHKKIIISKQDSKLIKSIKLSRFNNIRHGFFNRSGGVSKGIYKSLNCGIGSSDNKIAILNNLKIVCKKINTNTKKIVLLKQVHSNKFHFIGNQAPNFKNYWEPLMYNKPNNCIVWGERDDVYKFYQACSY